jgi:hypothetical protein
MWSFGPRDLLRVAAELVEANWQEVDAAIRRDPVQRSRAHRQQYEGNTVRVPIDTHTADAGGAITGSLSTPIAVSAYALLAWFKKQNAEYACRPTRQLLGAVRREHGRGSSRPGRRAARALMNSPRRAASHHAR